MRLAKSTIYTVIIFIILYLIFKVIQMLIYLYGAWFYIPALTVYFLIFLKVIYTFLDDPVDDEDSHTTYNNLYQ